MVDDEYERIDLRSFSLPPTESVGIWWRRRWILTLVAGSWQERVLPPPMVESVDAEMAMVVTASRLSSSEVVIESFTRDKVMTGDDLAYMSLIVAWLARAHSPEVVLVNGVSSHPFLSMSRITPEIVELFENSGY